ncbi:MAG: four helix bundle protein [Alphaproteobacteria bacterium]|nr:four helix bundle protein [Alphaproteobacteria bacterium]
MKIRNYKDLEVWQKGRVLVKQVYQLTKLFPKEEIYGLTAQLRRAVVSVPSNIAEGHSRSGTKDFIQFISVSIGSLAEVETQIILSEDLEFCQPAQTISIYKNIEELQRMLHALRSSLKAKL